MSPPVRTSLQRIESLTAKLEVIAAQRDLAIATALSNGATWSQIGGSLGCSPQAAHHRYRFIRFNPDTGETWHERPLPL